MTNMKNCNSCKKSTVCTLIKVIMIIGAIVAAAAFVYLTVKKMKEKKLAESKANAECDACAVDDYEVCDIGSLSDDGDCHEN